MNIHTKRIGLMVFSLVMFFLIGETASRYWLKHWATKDQYYKYALYTDIPAQEWELSPHHYQIYYPTPNYRRNGTVHNSLGYRGPEISRVKPPGVFRIALVGGSSTYDTAIPDNNQTFAAKLQYVLRNTYHAKRVEVINAGVPGYNSWESLINLEFRVLDLSPDLVIYYEAVNDVHARFVLPSAYRSDNRGLRQWWATPAIPAWERSCFFRILAREVNRTRQVELEDVSVAPTAVYMFNKANADTATLIGVLATNRPVFYERNLENMAAIAKAHHIGIMFATWAHCPAWHDYASNAAYTRGIAENNDVIRKVAERNGATLFDFAAEMPTNAVYWSDGRHSNAKGAQKKAELFAAFIDRQHLVTKDAGTNTPPPSN
ncbi:MAG: SGNH/GDSL hydrolase family protein [Kiritimatiellae bacterium]|nr:SGNH/GDSL hydrolase family protein [Kiritimatiellia bacterium]